jgi:hypothetical protein
LRLCVKVLSHSCLSWSKKRPVCKISIICKTCSYIVFLMVLQLCVNSVSLQKPLRIADPRSETARQLNPPPVHPPGPF